MKDKQKSLLSMVKYRVLLCHNTLPAFLQVAQTCVEFILYLLIISGLPIVQQLLPYSHASQKNVSLILTVLFLARIIKGVSLLRFCYVILIGWACNQVQNRISLSSILIFIGIAKMVIIDLHSNQAFDFYSQNISAESLNICKSIHYLFFTFGVVQAKLSLGPIFNAFTAGCFVSLWLFKRASMTHSSKFKELYLRMYMLIIFAHLMVIMGNYMRIPVLIEIVMPIIFSQAFFELYKIKKSQVKLDELFSQQKYLKLTFQVVNYMYGANYSKPMQEQIVIFFGQSLSKSQKQSQRKSIIYQRLTTIISRSNDFESQLILAQLYLFYDHQLLKSKKIIEQLRHRLGFSDWGKKLLLLRVEETMLHVYNQTNKEIHFPFYQSYYLCDQFRTLLLRSAIAFVKIWYYSKKTQVLPERLRQLGDKLVRIQRKIEVDFKHIPTKCLTLNLLYVSYLFEVSRDTIKANKILQGLVFNQDFQVNLQLNEKVFFKMNLEDQPLRIEQVGQNVSSILGYERKQLEGQKSQIFLPEFYRKSHKQYVTLFLQQNLKGMYLYNKKTIVRNRQGYYEECNIMLRLHYQLNGEIYLKGYFHIKPNPYYCWSNFLFVNQNQEIMECSQNLYDLMPTQSKLHRVDQYFSERTSSSKPLIMSSEQNTIEYHPIITLVVNQEKVTFFVRQIQSQTYEHGQIIQQKITSLMNSINIHKFQWEFVKNYLNKLQSILTQLASKEYFIISVVILAFFIAIFICQSYFMLVAKTKNQNETFVMSTSQSITKYLNSSLRLGMDVNYIDLNNNFNYSNTNSHVDFINKSLQLQTMNEQLKGFTGQIYTLPSLLPGIVYSKANYDMVMEFLSNAYMISQFSDDKFIQNMAITRARISIQTIFASSLGQYETNFISTIGNIASSTTIVEILTLCFVLILLVLIYAIILRLEYKLRLNQNKALSLVISNTDYEELIETVKIFISKVTRQDVLSNKHQIQIVRNIAKKTLDSSSFAPDVTDTGRDATKTEMSLREMSGRDLLGDSLNKSGFLQTLQTGRVEPRNSFAQRNYQLRLSLRNKCIIIVPLVIIVMIFGLVLANQIKNNTLNSLSQTTSVTNIFTLIKTSVIFSRSMVSYLNLLNLRASGIVNTTLFNKYLQNYSSNQLIQPFAQASFSEFKEFENQLTLLQYQYLCTYTSCDTNYASQINIIYTTTIQKIISAATNWTVNLNSINASTLTSLIYNGTLKQQIDLIYYSEELIRQLIMNTSRLYFNCYANYSKNLKTNKQMLISAVIFLTMLGFLFAIALAVYVYNNQKYLKEIVNFLKTDSYIDDKRQLLEQEPKNMQ